MPLTKIELFDKYSINESHNEWDNSIDNWYSVEVFRSMHNGELPNGDNETSLKYITDFLDKCHNDTTWFFTLKNRGSFYLTSKRMVYKFADQILDEING